MSRFPKLVRLSAAALGVLLAASALTYVWALGATDGSSLARAIAWQGADADDWERSSQAERRQ
jgi:hypothetical protein